MLEVKTLRKSAGLPGASRISKGMKILLINNHTRHLQSLNDSLAGHDVEIQMYQPGLDFHWQDKDLVILSGGGGEGLEIHDVYKKGKLWYDDQMKFVRECKLPIIGICMGFEVICRAFGSEVKELPKLIQGFRRLDSTQKGGEHFSSDQLKQFESHQWAVPSVDGSQFEVLAESKTGVELVRHRGRRLLASQFHPEKGGTLRLQTLITSKTW